MRRLVAIGFIWFGCALAWMVLGTTVVHRGGETSMQLIEEVRLLWGPPMVQAPPTASLLAEQGDAVAGSIPPNGQPATQEPAASGRSASEEPAAPDRSASDPNAAASPPTATPPQIAATEPLGGAATGSEPPPETMRLDASDIDVTLDLEQRKKGLIWFATYTVDFRARYAFANTAGRDGKATLRFPLASESVVYDAFKVLDAGGEPVDATIASGQAVWTEDFSAGQRREYTVIYRSRGTSSWGYGVAHQAAAKVKDFALRMSINTPEVDFPAGTLSPSSHSVDGDGWKGEWAFDSLVSSAPIGIELPSLLNPGPLAAQITFFAPVSLLFFFFVVSILAAARRKNIHPMNYFLLGCSFFAFHLLFAYLVDHVEVGPAFAISAAVSTLLVTSYARLFVGWRFALFEVGGAQLIYLVLFSFTFFWKGFTGLAITIGAILTLFVIMQITGRLDWSEAARLLRRDDPHPPRNPRQQELVPLTGPDGA